MTDGSLTEEDRIRRLDLLDEAFRPSAPVNRGDLFSGRGAQLQAITQSINTTGQHAVIFGERGIGKTSLSAYCVDLSHTRGLLAMRITCDQNDTFPLLWQKVIDELVILQSDDRWADSLEKPADRATETLMFDQIGPNQVRIALRHLTALAPVVIFIDEFDQIQDDACKSLLSNTIKLLSDQLEPMTLVPVGVADSVNELIAGHQSINRTLTQIEMPRMTSEELVGILDNGLATLSMTADARARGFVGWLPKGLPQYAHLLAQEACRKALLEGRTEINGLDVIDGLKAGLARVDHTLADAFTNATYTARKSRFADVLYACSLADQEKDGFFTPKAVQEPYSKILGEPQSMDRYHDQLVALASAAKGDILTRRGRERAWRYRFTDPLMEPYVLLHGIGCGRINLGQSAPAETTEQPPLS